MTFLKVVTRHTGDFLVTVTGTKVAFFVSDQVLR